MEPQNNRRKWLLATVLALLGAATLCVWGAAAAGIRFSSPPIEAAIQAFNESRAQEEMPRNTGGGGDVNISNPGRNGNGNGDNGNGGGNGNGDSNGNGNGNGDGGNDGAGSSGCLLGVLCLDANVNTGNTNMGGLGIDLDADTSNNGIQVDADVNSGTERCFLGLLCINSNTDASLTPRVNVGTNSVVQVNTSNAALLDANVDADLGRTNTLVDADVDVAADANLSTQSNSWLNNLLNLFVNFN